MLSKHHRKSRIRVTAGVTGAMTLMLAGLALTASGTQAAANLRADVGDAIGVDLQAPPAPPAPAAPEAPDAPPAPRASGTAKGEKKRTHVIRIVTKDKDGKVTVTETRDGNAPRAVTGPIVIRDGQLIAPPAPPAIPQMPDVPRVVSARCGGGQGRDVTIERKEGSERRIVICTDRIEARAADATTRARVAEAMAGQHRAMALAHADMGKRHAMTSIQMARRTIEAQDALSADQKAKALAGLDEAMRELESTDKD